MTRSAIRERQTVPRRGGSIKVPVRTTEWLIVVGWGEIVPRREQAADLDETRVLVECPWKRACGSLDLSSEIGIGGEERGRIGEAGERRRVVDGKGFVPHLSFVIA